MTTASEALSNALRRIPDVIANLRAGSQDQDPGIGAAGEAANRLLEILDPEAGDRNPGPQF